MTRYIPKEIGILQSSALCPITPLNCKMKWLTGVWKECCAWTICLILWFPVTKKVS